MAIAKEAARELAPRSARALTRRVRIARDAAGELGFAADHFDGDLGSDDPNPEGERAAQRWAALEVDASDLHSRLNVLLDEAAELEERAREAWKAQRAEDGIEVPSDD